jgi:molybdopterin-containing oxidoreductase family membrane subunit
MSSHYEATIRKPLVIGDKSYHDVTVDVAAPVEGKANKHWWIVFSIALIAFLWGLRLYYLHCINRYWNLGIK